MNEFSRYFHGDNINDLDPDIIGYVVHSCNDGWDVCAGRVSKRFYYMFSSAYSG